MRNFLVLSFVAIVSAGRLGYDYQPGISGSAGGPIFLDSSRIGNVSPGSRIGAIASFGSGSVPSIVGTDSGLVYEGSPSSSGSAGAPIFLDSSRIGTVLSGPRIGAISSFGSASGPSIAGTDSGPVYDGSDSSSRLNTAARDYELNKEFYHYTAPEEEFHDSDASQRVVSSLKKNLRVVFIKAPENNGLTKAALQLAKQATNDKTAIYILSKQPDISELANQVQELRASVSHKPEVRFIKYRTPEDAINAQMSIQQQYDALRGSSRISDEGIASVLDFSSVPQQRVQSVVGGVDLGGSESALDTNPSGGIGVGGRREYLPPLF